MGNEVLTLVSEPAFKPDSPQQKVCGSCAWYEAKRGPTGRVLRSHAGRCTWNPPSYDMPLAVIRAIGPFPPIVYRVAMFKDTNAETCKCWKPK